MLRTDHQIDIDAAATIGLMDEDAEPPDTHHVFDALTKAGATGLPGFSVAPRLVIGNFSYAKLPMVLDMQAALETLVESDLILECHRG